VTVLHRKTFTYLDDLIKDEYFGEISFFSSKPRTLTVKSRDFTEVYIIDKEWFLDTAGNYPQVLNLFHKIRSNIEDANDYSLLLIECYICKKLGHIAIDCKDFQERKGNLLQIYSKMMKKAQEKNNSKGDNSDTFNSSLKMPYSMYNIY